MVDRKRKRPAWGKRELRKVKEIEAQLPSWAKPKFRQIERLMTKGTPDNRAVARLSRELCTVFRSASPKLTPELLGRVVAQLLDSIHYADVLSENLREITRIEGPLGRERTRAILLEIQEVALDGQRRQVEGLRRDIPLMLKQLSAAERRKK